MLAVRTNTPMSLITMMGMMKYEPLTNYDTIIILYMDLFKNQYFIHGFEMIIFQLEKYQNSEFGTCIRVFCESQLMLPIGLADNPGT